MSRALGRYELLRPLARGGMGEVYLARRRAAGVEKWLVVKRMRPEKSGDTRFLDLFMREAKLTMSLTHQNIVPVFDFGRIDDQVFLAMERVEGKDLGSSLARAGKPMPELLAAFIAAECLQALDYAHRRKGPDGAGLGIVHRDVTPRNVLLSWAGEVKLTDFGIAVLAGDPTSKAAGTPAYMAPEQARGESIDVRADIYAVGLVLREALAGVRARGSSERETVLDQAKQGRLDPWPEAVDSPLKAIADRATAADKDARYADARAMAEDLDAYMVAQRAAHKADPPARQLAAWLGEVWKDAREEDEALDAKIEADVLVSFLDDGALDVLGTGTQRSMLATAADESASSQPALPIAKQEPTPPEPKPEPKADAKPQVAEPVGSRVDQKRLATERVIVPPPTKRFPIWIALVGLAIVIIVIWAWPRGGDRKQQLATVPADAAVTMASDAALAPPVDAAVAEQTTDAAVITEVATDAGALARRTDAGAALPRPRADAAAVEPARPDAAAPTGDKPTRRVTINSKPWSNWSVDGGAQHSGLDTIELTPGKHTIHFTGNPYFKADKTVTIEVPDRDGFTHVETLEAPP